VASADYWANHLRGTVRFADGMSTLMSVDDAVFVECGPGNTLSTFARQSAGKKNSHSIIQTIRHPKTFDDDNKIALSAFGKLWLAGVDINWHIAHGDLPQRRIPLPTYPFEHQYYWVEPGHGAIGLSAEKPLQKQNYEDWFYQSGWATSAHIHYFANEDNAKFNIVVFINDNENSAAIVNQFKNWNLNCYTIKQGDSYKVISEFEYRINAQQEQDYKTALKAINKVAANNISHIIHNWSIKNETDKAGLDDLENELSVGFSSLLFIAKYLTENEPGEELLVTVNTNNSQQVSSEIIASPIKATMLGPIKVMTQEINNVSCKILDIDFDIQQEWKKEELISLVCADALVLSEAEDIAYRGAQRFIKSYNALPVENNETKQSALIKGGNYLISGGIGGIGYVLAKYLVDKYAANLIILNRMPLPEKSTWDNTDELDSKVIDRIEKLKSLETNENKILSFNADVCDFDTLNTSIKSAIKTLGILNGVFHTAGIVADNLIAFKALDDAKKVLAPKVEGLINIDKALGSHKPDFIFLFSSISTELGLSGQVDYTAANSFLNAYAKYKNDKDGINVISANWGVWSETGMASTLGALDEEKTVIDDHYFYTQKNKIKAETYEFSANLSAKTHWIIDEHRSKNNVSLIPGTAYLELARAAYTIDDDIDKPVRLSDVFFVSPFVIEGDEEKRINVQLTKNINNSEFLIESEFGEENVRGVIGYVDLVAPENLHVDNIIERCNKSKLELKGTAEHNHLIFGNRWRCMNAIYFGKKEAMVEIEVQDEFANELNDYVLHPAIMDMATGTAQSLNHDYDPVKDLYIPISYSHITVYKKLCKKMYSHVVYSADDGQGSETSIFDVVVCNEKGEVLVVVNQFIMKRVDPSVLQSLNSNRTPLVHPEKTASDLFFESGLKYGMKNSEGLRAIDTLLTEFKSLNVIISSLPFFEYKYNAKKLRDVDGFDDELDEDSFEGLERPNISSEFVSPESEIEISIAKIWKSALGISDVGIEDDFFELGGHSLLLTQVVSRLKKHVSMDLPINSLFETPTIKKWAVVISENEHLEGEVIPLVVALNRQDYAIKYSELLVSM